MKLNLSGWYNGRIGLEKKVIDLSGFEIRNRITNQDVERYYDECVKKLADFSDYFEDRAAFQDSRGEITEKKPKLIAREAVYPWFFSPENFRGLESMFKPHKKIRENKYFYAAHCYMIIPLKESVFVKLVDDSDENITRVSEEEYKKEKSKIEIPNDRTQAETKSSTYHETLHYFITNYQLKSGRLFTKDDTNHSKIERYIAEKWIQEGVVDCLTDLLLEDDEDALFEQRWLKYKLEKPQINLPFMLGTALLTGWLIGSSIGNLKLISLIPIPAIISQIIYNKYKASKKEELTRITKKEKFKI